MLTRLALPKTKQGLALLKLLISYNQLYDSQSNTLTEIMTKTKITKQTLVCNVIKELYVFTSIFWKMYVLYEVANSSTMTSYYDTCLKLAARYH